ncbi:mechanosensitive ion channel [Candidatus Dojkabacteria bacterium]|uniref:Mechanosensitive ion channel n=1 Tax=Candidatus Dojkabacteria bacterium TaxID=2099670 RepID=A0A955I743_9BACT|nr:mechanosensitive ion channel [Candidatus Dojkabacteria bacterium]
MNATANLDLSSIEQFLNSNIISWENFALTPKSIIVLLVVILLTKIAVALLKNYILKNAFRGLEKAEGTRLAVFQISKYIVYVMAILISLTSLGINLNIILAGSAALFVGLGFGLQGTFNDFVSGLILLFDQSVQIGDVLEVGGVVGKVTEIGLRTSKIETPDSVVIILPNSKLTADSLINWSHNRQLTRFSIEVGVAYDTDIETAQAVMIKAAAEHSQVMGDPGPKVVIKDFADSAILLDLLFWTEETFAIEQVKSDIRYRILHDFRSQQVEIPFPQRDVHLVGGKQTNEISEVI